MQGGKHFKALQHLTCARRSAHAQRGARRLSMRSQRQRSCVCIHRMRCYPQVLRNGDEVHVRLVRLLCSGSGALLSCCGNKVCIVWYGLRALLLCCCACGRGLALTQR